MDTTSLLPDACCFLETPTLTFHSTEAAFPALAFDFIMVDSFQPVTPVQIVTLSVSHQNYNIFLHFPSFLTNFPHDSENISNFKRKNVSGNFYIETLAGGVCNMCRYVCTCALNVIQKIAFSLLIVTYMTPLPLPKVI